MSKRKKGQLPSGNIRIQKKVGTRPDGSRIMKSFTGSSRAEAEFKYREYMAKGGAKSPKLTVSSALERYIDAKDSVLSPSTIVNYRRMYHRYIEDTALGYVDVSELTNTDLQIWISDLSDGRSPKTVRNVYTLVKSAVEMFNPDFRFKVTLPAPQKVELYCPSDNDVRILLDHVTDKDLRIAILLAAFGPLRRSEICALTSDDISGNTITVSKAMVQNSNKDWEVKGTKTYGSYRRIEMPENVIAELKGINGRIIQCTPSALSDRWQRAISAAGCPRFRFHDLRHYSASIMHAIGIPDQYIMQRGGWSTDSVMKRVYRNVIDIESSRQNRKIKDHFNKLAK